MKKNVLLIIVILCAIKLAIHIVGNQNYGFHRDELLHVSVSEHLAWGYMEFPPFIAVVGKIATIIFDHSIAGIRLFSTLAGIGILILTCLLAKEMGGKKSSILLAGVAVLSFLPFYRNHTLFQPVAFDQFFWTLGFYFIVRFITTKEDKFLIWTGICCGFGLLNKYTFVIWLLSIVIAMLFYDRGALLKNKYLYIACAIAFLMAVPNVIWQYLNDFPALVHQQKLREIQLEKIDPFEFGAVQLEFPFTLALSIIGLYGLFTSGDLKRFRPVGIAVVLIFVLMWLLHSKAYYFFAAYPVLFAAGGVMLERLLREKEYLRYACAAVLFLPVAYYIPRLTPILPIEQFVTYAKLDRDETGRYTLTNDYADMFGWKEQVLLVDSVYKSLAPVEQKSCIILAGNYGEAGAVKVLGDEFDLPEPIAVHGSFWTFGPPKQEYTVCISIGNDKETLERLFEDVTLVKVIKHRFAIEEENNVPVFICKKPRLDLRTIWPDLKKYIFS